VDKRYLCFQSAIDGWWEITQRTFLPHNLYIINSIILDVSCVIPIFHASIALSNVFRYLRNVSYYKCFSAAALVVRNEMRDFFFLDHRAQAPVHGDDAELPSQYERQLSSPEERKEEEQVQTTRRANDMKGGCGDGQNGSLPRCSAAVWAPGRGARSPVSAAQFSTCWRAEIGGQKGI